MAYVKVPTLLQDAFPGLETINQLRDNLDWLYTAWSYQHLVEAPGHGDVINTFRPGASGIAASLFDAVRQFGAGRLGQHSLLMVPLGVATIVHLDPLGGTPYTDLGFDLVFIEPTGGFFGPAYRFSAGSYLVPIGTTTAKYIWAEATAVEDSDTVASTPYIVNARMVSNYTATVPGPAVLVNCYRLNAGAFVAADITVTLAVYGE